MVILHTHIKILKSNIKDIDTENYIALAVTTKRSTKTFTEFEIHKSNPKTAISSGIYYHESLSNYRYNLTEIIEW